VLTSSARNFVLRCWLYGLWSRGAS